MSPSHQWEICEVGLKEESFHLGKDQQLHFSVAAIGPHGPYTAAESAPFSPNGDPNLYNPDSRRCLYLLISRLLADGWEPYLPRQGPWYAYAFRRPANDISQPGTQDG